eukprot:14451739-Alexandrium_andersonii.AAC.1
MTSSCLQAVHAKRRHCTRPPNARACVRPRGHSQPRRSSMTVPRSRASFSGVRLAARAPMT